MALITSRLVCRNIRNSLSVLNRSASNDSKLPDPMELATGPEKWQLDQIIAGNDDPFKMRAIKRHASSKANPIKVSSVYDSRIIGCICEEDSSSVCWMWLFKGEPKRCRCGHWFKLEEYRPV